MYTPILQPRNDETSGLPQQTIIIIAACSGGGGLLILLVLFRLIRNRRAKPPVPLPPVQPLAHHREHQLAQFGSSLRPETWYETKSVSSRPFNSKSLAGSKVSLLREGSLATSPSIPTSSVSHHSLGPEIEVSSYGSQRNLALPISSNATDSSLSVGFGGTEESFSTSTPPSPATPAPRSRTSSASPRRPRPMSMSSSNSHNSRASRHTIRGTPHGPLSNVQVILPEPLAPFEGGNGSHLLPRSRTNSGAYDRRSIADPWISVGNLNDMAQRPSTPLGSIAENTRPRRSQSLPRTGRSSVIPPVPQLPTNWDDRDHAQTGFRSVSDSAATRVSQVFREDGDGTPRKNSRKHKKQT